MSMISPLNRLKSGRGLATAAIALVLAAALPYAADAQARGHGHWRAGAFIGGVVVGAAIARPHYYPYYRPYYAPPPVYYAPSAPYYPPASYYPPAVVYSPPPAPVTYIEQQPNYVTAPAAATPQLPLEQRLRRLKAMCDQGLFTPHECSARREEILREM